jgi:hypothetical protein
MKVRLVSLVAILTLLGFIQTPATAVDKPEVESFIASQIDIDLSDKNLKIDFEVVVSHAAGIDNRSTTLILTNSSKYLISTSLIRTDSPIDFTKNKVTFQGTIELPRTLDPGVYTFFLSDGFTSNLNNGYKVNTGPVLGPVLRNLKGAESGILVRSGGFLDLDYVTINGPAYGLQTNKSYINSSKYPSPIDPLWKVGEIFTPSDYFEEAVTGAPIEISTSSPKICTTDGKIMKLISIGECTFTISTPRTKDYKAKLILQTVTITAGRSEQKLFIENVSPRKAQNLPITMTLSAVYASGISAVEYVLPKSKTPDICEVTVYSLKVYSGGNCVLTYQSLGNSSYLPSEIYTQTIVFEKAAQSIVFMLPPTAKVSDKTLNLTATASSGNQITYSSTPNSYCTISGTVLNLLQVGGCLVTATQAGNSTIDPVSASAEISITGITATVKKTISCIKGKTSKKVIGTNPKCPAGYKLKK